MSSSPSTSLAEVEEEKRASSSYSSDSGEQDQMMGERVDGISTHFTLVNFMKGMIGSGILTLPIVFRQAGLWTAFGLVFLFGALNTVTMHMLVKCAHQLARRKKGELEGPLSYGEVMDVAVSDSFAWARPYAGAAKLFVNATIVVLQVGIGCIKYDFIVAHLRELFDEFTPFHASSLVWTLLIFPPMVLLNFTRTLRRIALLNTFGNLFMFGAYGIIFYHLVQPPHQTLQLPAFTHFSGVLSACGSILYCFEGQAMVLPMENKMRHPSEMVSSFGVLTTGMALTTIFDAAVGFLGYAKFGAAIDGSVTLNLPPTLLLTGVKLVFTAISFLDFLLQQYVTIQMIWPPLRKRIARRIDGAQSMGEGPQHPQPPFSPLVLCCEYLFRTALVALTMFIAIFVPNLEQIMPLVGFSGGVFLAFVFPPLIDTFTFAPSLIQSRSRCELRWRLLRNAIFVGIGVLGSFAGLRSSLADIFCASE